MSGAMQSGEQLRRLHYLRPHRQHIILGGGASQYPRSYIMCLTVTTILHAYVRISKVLTVQYLLYIMFDVCIHHNQTPTLLLCLVYTLLLHTDRSLCWAATSLLRTCKALG
jgi:hypothetical protein